MNQEELEEALHHLPLGKVQYCESVTSTNDVALEMAEISAPDCSLIVANHQSRGRGRGNNKWITKRDASLAFSMILNASLQHDSIPMIRFTGLAAIAVCEALSNSYNLSPEIKWPNDVLLDRQKVCGVLAEIHWMGERPETIILGIGVNLSPAAIPNDIPLNYPATSVEEVLQKPVSRLPLLRSIIQSILIWKEKIDSVEFIECWSDYLAFKDEQIHVYSNNDCIHTGRLIDLDERGNLLIQTADGDRITLQYGEIHLRPVVDKRKK